MKDEKLRVGTKIKHKNLTPEKFTYHVTKMEENYIWGIWKGTGNSNVGKEAKSSIKDVQTHLRTKEWLVITPKKVKLDYDIY